MSQASMHQEGYDPAYFQEIRTIEEEHFWFTARKRLIVYALNRFFPNITSFLEVGAGTGEVLKYIRLQLGLLDIAALELLPEASSHLTENLPGVPVKIQDITQSRLERAFSVIGSFDVLEHIQNDDKALKVLFEGVRPGGGIVLTVPQHKWLWSENDVQARHCRRYSRTEIKNKMAEAGFTHVKCISFNSLLVPAMYLYRSKVGKKGNWKDEFQIKGWMNLLGKSLLWLEYLLLKTLRISLPWGGSLLVIGKKEL